MFQDYQDQVNFRYVYKSLAHPAISGYVSAQNINERAKHIAEFQKQTQSKIPWICDTMDNTFRDAFGKAPNGEFVLDAQGVVIRQKFWSNPETLRQLLVEQVGAVDSVTKPEDVLVSYRPLQRTIASGVMPQMKLPKQLMPLVIQPGESEHPMFAKLRVEATRPTLQGEQHKGQLFLGMYLDPLYRVHWNNEIGPVRVSIQTTDGITLGQNEFTAEKIAAKADIDPRLFLTDIHRVDQDANLQVTVSYTVCDDDETFCLSIEQTYTVTFETDRGLGSRAEIFIVDLFKDTAEMDKDGNGIIEGDEFPENKSSMYLSHMDLNLDGKLDMQEVDRFMSLFNDGRGLDPQSSDSPSTDAKQ